MSSSPVGHGSVLAGRYRLEDLLSDHDGARFWRAADAVLSRDVAVHVVTADDPRAAAMLEAARLSTTVHDTRLLRVLDADVQDDCAYVVHEWGQGSSVDVLLAGGPLSPRRSAWLVKETADCLAACHMQGIAHGRLLPENVLVNEAGGVKLIGFVVDSVLRERPVTWPTTGRELEEHESDVVNLAAMLYVCLTGRWPGTSGSSVPEAPAEQGRVLRPRQVRAGVPRVLDSICSSVLSRDPDGPPTESTARQIAADLAGYVGDPLPSEPVLVLDDDSALGTYVPDDDSESTQVLRRSGPDDAARTQVTPATDPGGSGDPDATEVGAPVFYDDDTGVGWVGGAAATGVGTGGRSTPPQEAPSTGPAVDGVRPLFAPETDATRRVPRPSSPSQTDTAARRLSESSAGDATGGSLWPFSEDDGSGSPSRNTGRGWLRLAGGLALVVVMIIAVLLAFNLGQRSSLGILAPSDETGSSSSSPSASASQAAGQDWPIRGVSDFDPQGDGTENSESAGLAIDGDPTTAWDTLTYRNRPDLGGLKDGVGLVVDLGRQRDVGSVSLVLRGSPTGVQVLAAPGQTSAPTDRAGFTRVGGTRRAGERATISVKDGTTTRFLAIWLTSLPEISASNYKGYIAEITVSS